MQNLRTPGDLELTHAELHDLCQPLTALQCRLEIGRMIGQQGALEEAVLGGLEETARLFAVIERMRSRLLQIEQGIAPQHTQTAATR